MSRYLRFVAAVAILVGGYVHLDLYRTGYSHIPTIGKLFLVNMVTAGLLALGLVFLNVPLTHFAGILWGLATGGMYVLTRYVTIFGFKEKWNAFPPRDAIALIAEGAAVVFLIASLVAQEAARRRQAA